MTIAELRKMAPDWNWSARRKGMGWQYEGWRGENKVRVYACAVICGPMEDDCATQWRADDGRCSQDVYSWSARLREGRGEG